MMQTADVSALGQRTALARLVQISDLHFGRIVGPKSGDHPLISAAEDWWERHSACDGYLGHDFSALQAFNVLWKELRKKAPAPLLVMTGDLTSCGHTAEFELGDSYLGDVVKQQRGAPLGLRNTDWKRYAIPGNHDCWRGTYSQSVRDFPQITQNATVSGFFSMTPWHEHPVRNGGPPLWLTFAGINSFADASRIRRLVAGGSCVSQCHALDSKMTSLGKMPGELRVLLIHHKRHSLSSSGFDLRSKRALDRLVATHEFDVVLSGHTHEMSLPRPGASPLWITCGSTTQRLTTPSTWQRQASRRLAKENIALLHEIHHDHHGIVWTVTPYTRETQHDEFTAKTHLAQDYPLQ